MGLTVFGKHCTSSAVGMRSSASITKVMSALIPGEQRQTALLDGAPLEDADKFKYLGPTLAAKDQDTEETRSRINLTCSEFSHLQSCFLSRRGISLSTTSRVYQAVVRLILL